MLMLTFSLLANVAITFAVTFAIWRNSDHIAVVFGPDTPARRILACVYLAIGVASLYALVQLAAGQPDVTRAVAITLMPLQIVYKLMTAISISPRHPVVAANLCIVALHAVTLLTL